MKIIGLKIFKQKVVNNKKGDILKFLSKRDFFFKKFGETYFTEVKKNKTKGWNYHKKNNCIIAVPYGKVNFWFIDGRKNSSSYYKEDKIIIGKKNYKVIVTFHPAYLLRKPDQKKFSWEDLKIIRKEIDKQNIEI